MNQTELDWTDIVFDKLTNVRSSSEFKQWMLYTQLDSTDAVCTRLNVCVCLSVCVSVRSDMTSSLGPVSKNDDVITSPTVCDVTSSNVIAHTHTRDFGVYIRTAIIAINITKKEFQLIIWTNAQFHFVSKVKETGLNWDFNSFHFCRFENAFTVQPRNNEYFVSYINSSNFNLRLPICWSEYLTGLKAREGTGWDLVVDRYSSHVKPAMSFQSVYTQSNRSYMPTDVT